MRTTSVMGSPSRSPKNLAISGIDNSAERVCGFSGSIRGLSVGLAHILFRNGIRAKSNCVVTERSRLFNMHQVLTPADHQTHRRFLFQVPPECQELQIAIRYVPKHLGERESVRLAEAALVQQAAELATR